ncbi:MAG: acetylxylan esterase [Synoicihabitans sp.]
MFVSFNHPYVFVMMVFRLLLLSTLLVSISRGAESTALHILLDSSDGVYDVGDDVRWNVGRSTAVSKLPAKLDYTFKAGGATVVDSGQLTTADLPVTLTSTFGEPGTMLLEVSWMETDKKQQVWAGAVAAPDRIEMAVDSPDDFDAFWDSKIAELERVPAAPQLRSQSSNRDGVCYWHVEMNGYEGSKIRGQIARPERGGPYPALLRVQWAGVYGLRPEWVTDRAEQGWLALNILPHDLPIDEDDAFYAEQRSGPLKDYFRQGNEDRETSYFLRMYLSCYRAVEYLKSRTDWDGNVLVVTGTSQGGQQAFVTAGLHPAVTAAMALVPAGADFNGHQVGRSVGFPYWSNIQDGRNTEAVARAGGYYDIVNFARRIRAPMLIGVGLEDITCPPAGIFAAANQLKGKHEIVILPQSGHQDVNGTQQPFRDRMEQAWLPALREGKPAPISSP